MVGVVMLLGILGCWFWWEVSTCHSGVSLSRREEAV